MTRLPKNANIATLTWEIENYSQQISRLISQSFSFPNNQNIKLNLILYPKVRIIQHTTEKTATTTDLIGISLCVQVCYSKISLICRVSLVNSKSENCSTQEKFIEVGNMVSASYDEGFYFYPRKVNDLELLVNDKLIIYCEVQIDDSTASQVISQDKEFSDSLAQDYGSLLESGLFSDVVLLVGGKALKAHKNVLASRSKVFAGMFEQNLKGNHKVPRIEVTDVDTKVFDELLRYIYTGKVASQDRYTVQLLAAAEKYQLDLLKSICEKYLIDTLTVNSVAQILLLADLHQTTQLKAKCIDYITEHAKDIKLADWKVICERNLNLAHQLFQYKR